MSDEQAIDALKAIAREQANLDARDFFEMETDRLARFSCEAAGLSFDFSKQAIPSKALDALINLANEKKLLDQFKSLARGDAVNASEGRAAQHVALRGGGYDEASIEKAEAELSRAFAFAEGIRSGEIKTASGERFSHILHIGIGGSDLGPRLIYDAFRKEDAPLEVRFLSSLDPSAFDRALEGLDPRRTLVFIVSKSFGTPETSLNAQTVMEWLEAGVEDGIGQHLAAATANPAKAGDLGISEDFLFEMWDWVGGRYSLWSVVSTSVIAAIGVETFDRLLSGAREMDDHAFTAPPAQNASILSALTLWWHRAIKGQLANAVVPYSIRLRLLTSWLQQLSMESLGKNVSLDGKSHLKVSGHVVWGGEGPDGQHAYFQLLHQGSEDIPVDLIAFASGGRPDHQIPLLLNAVAQGEALLKGRTLEAARQELLEKGLSEDEASRAAPHMVMPGGRSSTFILGDVLSPERLGALLSFYEHQTFALSVLYGLNAFDQFGVELGKQLARSLELEWQSGGISAHDPSTTALIQTARDLRNVEGDSGA